ncbi:MAG: hypothetical protein CMG55_10035 [Candidatus Marinimicrobia bacterium]|nr:hypothetical protein [Candidatus Neomarinimicrobiota bacterium]|tara:strand:+ start:11533 stop:11961 length:429 start_codon:yes stop_codon:yes gene_type:complete
MKYTILYIFLVISLCCSSTQQINERKLLERKIEAFQFLSEYHHQLHIMIGEEDGDIKKAYNEFYNAVLNLSNIELLPIQEAFSRINSNDVTPNSENVKRLDYLVDYYQSGLSMQIEGIFRGHGHLEILDMGNAINLYDKIQR